MIRCVTGIGSVGTPNGCEFSDADVTGRAVQCDQRHRHAGPPQRFSGSGPVIVGEIPVNQQHNPRQFIGPGDRQTQRAGQIRLVGGDLPPRGRN